MVNINKEKIYLNMLKEIILIVSTDMTVEFANNAACKIMGLELSKINDVPVWELPMWQHDLELQNELMFTFGHVFSMEESKRLEIRAMNSSEELVELDFLIQPIVQDGEVIHLIATGYNLSELVKAKGFLTRRERQIGAFFKNSTQGYFFQTLPEAAIIPEVIDEAFINQIYEAQRLESVSNKIYEYLNMPVKEGVHEMDVMTAMNIDEKQRTTMWYEMLRSGAASMRTELLNSDTGEKTILELKFVAIIFEESKFEGNFCIVTNITQQIVYERELNFLANKDPLTGLNNRRNFHRLAGNMLDGTVENYCVGMLDIDKFKNINDTYGHDVGDIAIRNVADIIEDTIGSEGVVGRYGGEEFIIILPMNGIDALEVVEDVRRKIENSVINYGTGSLKMTISGGIHEFSCVDEKCDEVFNNAIILSDNALLEAKRTGRNRTIIYDDELHGNRAIDKLTGTYNKNALLYKHRQFHEDLRKSDVPYGMVVVKLNALMIKQLEIVNQFVKQTAGMLHGMLREHDVVGRYNDEIFVVLIKGVDKDVVANIGERIDESIIKLSNKFDHLVTAKTAKKAVNDWSIKMEEIYVELHLDS